MSGRKLSSIISGKMSETSFPGAEQPLITADNMRLDVELWPLLSHQLEVRIDAKGAVVRQTPESKAIPKITPPSVANEDEYSSDY